MSLDKLLPAAPTVELWAHCPVLGTFCARKLKRPTKAEVEEAVEHLKGFMKFRDETKVEVRHGDVLQR